MAKIVKPIKKFVLDVEAIRLYIPELNKEIDCTRESREKPKILVKLTKRNNGEIEIVFLGIFNVLRQDAEAFESNDLEYVYKLLLMPEINRWFR